MLTTFAKIVAGAERFYIFPIGLGCAQNTPYLFAASLYDKVCTKGSTSGVDKGYSLAL